jgi:hypothetical protein
MRTTGGDDDHHVLRLRTVGVRCHQLQTASLAGCLSGRGALGRHWRKPGNDHHRGSREARAAGRGRCGRIARPGGSAGIDRKPRAAGRGRPARPARPLRRSGTTGCTRAWCAPLPATWALLGHPRVVWLPERLHHVPRAGLLTPGLRSLAWSTTTAHACAPRTSKPATQRMKPEQNGTNT